MRVEESLNVTFDESPPPTKLSPLVDDDVGEDEAIENNIKVVNNDNIEDGSVEVDNVVNIKESKNHPLKQPKNVNEALGDKSWVVSIQEDLNQFVANDVWDLVPLPKNHTVIGTKWVYRNKLDENGIVSRNKARIVAQEYNQQEGMVDNTLFKKKFKSHLIIVQIYVDDIIFGSSCQNLCDDFVKIMHDEFEMSMMGELNFFLGLQIKQMEEWIFFNQSKYINEMLKKFGLEDSKPTKTLMLTEIKLTKNDEDDSVNSTDYRGLYDGIMVVFGLREVGFHYRLPKLRPLVDAFDVSVRIAIKGIDNGQIPMGRKPNDEMMASFDDDDVLGSCDEGKAFNKRLRFGSKD
ncbi:copia protein [Tanacetum coccineum]|uniref:Copia protein n=1 Tax=Tanacetum coccineum TaxID=301880 RepID=A0ABQ4X248_9ASTR